MRQRRRSLGSIMWHALKPIEDKIRRVVLDVQWTLWNFESAFLPEIEPPTECNRILCVSLNYLGDLIAITPSIHALKQKFPEAEIVVWVNQGHETIFKGNPDVDKVITDFNGQLYDCLVVFHIGRWWHINKVYNYVKGIPYKVGITNAGMFSSWFPRLNQRVKYRRTQHIVEDNLDVVRLLGADTKEKKYRLFHKKTKTGFEVHPSFKKSKPIMVLHPGSKNIDKLKNPSHWWAPGNWNDLGKYFSKDYNIFITGAKSEKFIYQLINIYNTNNNFIDATGAGDIRHLINIIANADVVVSMDSGPVHIASALDIPVVSLMGPQDPKIWRPWGAKGIYINKANHHCKKLSCRECNKKYMPAITVDEVVEAVEQLLTR